MSLGSQFCRRSSSVRSFAENCLQAPGDRDPLLFLYPRWFSASSSLGSPAPLSRNKRRFYSIGREAYAPQAGPDQEQAIRDAGSSSQGQAVQQQTASGHGHASQHSHLSHRPDFRHSKPIDNGNWPFNRSAEIKAAEKGVESVAAVESLDAFQPLESSIDGEEELRRGDGVVNPKNKDGKGDGHSKELEPFDHNFQMEKPSLDSKNKHRVEKTAKAAAKHKENKSLVNKHLKYKSPLSADWRVPLTELEKHSPIYSAVGDGTSVEQMHIPEESIARFHGDLDGKLLAIKLRTGCHVAVSNLLGDDVSGQQTITLKGSAESIGLAREYVSEMFAMTNERGLSAEEESQKQDQNHQLVENIDQKKSQMVERPPVRADAVPRPQTWTAETFARYVDQLTTYNIPRSFHRQLYRQGEEHGHEVARIIKELFKDPAHDSVISTEALNSALRFLYKQAMIPAARMLFIRIEMLNLRLNTETFNIMMRGASAAGDLHNFTFLLRLMIQRGICPDGGTWIALLNAVESSEVKLHVARRMKAKGLLHDQTVLRAVVAEIMPNAFRMYMDDRAAASETSPSSPDALQFLSKIDRIFPPQWPSLTAANKMLNELGARGLMDQACKVLEWFKKRGVRADIVSLNTLLMHAQRHRNEHAAIKLLVLLTTKYRAVPDKITYDLLFKLAWRSQLYNVARVVWRYACCAGHVSYAMQRHVLQSLLHGQKSRGTDDNSAGNLDVLSVREIWLRSAGKVIVGVSPSGSADIHVGGTSHASSSDSRDMFVSESSQSSSQSSSSIYSTLASSLPDTPISSTANSQHDHLTLNASSTTASTPPLHTQPLSTPPSTSQPSIYNLIATDLATATRFHPSAPLSQSLELALERDKLWARTGAWDTRDVRWKMENAVDVSVQ